MGYYNENTDSWATTEHFLLVGVVVPLNRRRDSEFLMLDYRGQGESLAEFLGAQEHPVGDLR
jgi:hypothetical protein